MAINKDVKVRIDKELKILEPKDSAKVYEDPDVVIYYNLPSPLGIVDVTDVLVQIPNGYPGATIDYVFLPDGSPLLNIVKGAPQVIIEAHGQRWQQISYHPHQGGGAPAWDSTKHGFHTYIDEILTWLSSKK